MTEKMICSRCVLPPHAPDITLDEHGVCNICKMYENKSSRSPETPLFESDLVKILNKYRGKNKYDCLVMCSGGKDSTASLYLMKNRYRLNPLAFTFDHGFEPEGAIENIKNAVDILGIDFLFFRSSYMKKMFASIVANHSNVALCHPCSIWYMQLSYDIAAKYNIPIIVAGWTKGQSADSSETSACVCNQEFISMSKATRTFLESLKDDPVYGDFPRSMEECLRVAKKRHNAMVISPHWFLQGSSEDYIERIQKELKWKFTPQSYPARSTNCYLNFLSVHYSLKHYGYTHYHVEMSKMIRAGLMTREEALEKLKINYDESLLRSIASKLGVNGV